MLRVERNLLAFAAAMTVVAWTANVNADDMGARESFLARCRSSAVVVCLPFDRVYEVERYRSTPRHLAAADHIQLDGSMGAARFTIPPRSGSDTSGMLDVPFPEPLINVYVSFDVRYPKDLLDYRFKTGGGWKMFILGQGKEGCAPYEVVGVNAYYANKPVFYYMCKIFEPVAKRNPYGDNGDEFDLQPGGDTECLMHRKNHPLPCAHFIPNEWVTYQVHVGSVERRLEVWQTVRGKTMKLIDFPLTKLPSSPVAYEWIKLTPYNTGKENTEDHPRIPVWYRRLIVSTAPIPAPVAD